jgi:hypothetical protein
MLRVSFIRPLITHSRGTDEVLVGERSSGRGREIAISRSTTSESAERSRAGTCFALTEQVSEETGPARLVLVPNDGLVAVDRDACLAQRSRRADHVRELSFSDVR